MFSSAPSPASLGWGRGRKKKKSEGPLWLLIVLISPLDSPLIALLCLQGHHYSDQAQLCFSLLFMNIILPNDCFEVFSRQGSHLITYRYVNPRAFLARAGHNIFHMRGLSSLQQIRNPKHFLKCFSPPLSVYLLKSSAAAFGVLAARGQGANIQSASELGGTKNPHVCVSLSRWKRRLFFVHVGASRLFDALIKCFVLLSFGEKEKSVPLCFSLWNLRLWWEGERSRSFSPPGLSCSLALAPFFWQLNWIKGGKKKKSCCLFCLEGRRATKWI